MENLQFLIDYHVWAHERILASLSGLSTGDWDKDSGGSFPTLKALYQHVLEGDYRWLQRWKGVPFAPTPGDYVVEGAGSLDRLFRPQLAELAAEGKQQLEGNANRMVKFITGKGLHVEQPFWQTLYQVVNHGTYHRGQMADRIRMLGGQPAGTDIFLFFRERTGGEK